jgi:propionyl-CoA carboxylase alpha chain
MLRGHRDRAAQLDGQLSGHERRVPDDWVVIMNGEQHPVTVMPAEGGYDVAFAGHTYAVRSPWRFGQLLFSGTINGEDIHVQVEREDQVYRLSHGGSQADVKVVTPRVAKLMRHMPVKAEPDLSGFLLSPMPGLLVSVAVEEGQQVAAGEELAVIEAMKMENTLLATRDGVVSSINYQPGDSLAVDDRIMEFE